METFRGLFLENLLHLADLWQSKVTRALTFSGYLCFQRRRQISPGVFTLTPEQYVPILKNLGVSCIVRFNDKCYDRKVFTNGGIKYVQLNVYYITV